MVWSPFLEIYFPLWISVSCMHPCNNFGLWTVNNKSEECVTLHSDFFRDVLWIKYQTEVCGSFTSGWCQELFDTPSYYRNIPKDLSYGSLVRKGQDINIYLFLNFWTHPDKNAEPGFWPRYSDYEKEIACTSK